MLWGPPHTTFSLVERITYGVSSITSGIFLCHTDLTDSTDLFMSRRLQRHTSIFSRRNEGNKGNYFLRDFNISLADVRLYLSQFVRVCLCLSMAFPNVVPLYRQCKAVFTGTCTRNYSYVLYEVFLRVPGKKPAATLNFFNFLTSKNYVS